MKSVLIPLALAAVSLASSFALATPVCVLGDQKAPKLFDPFGREFTITRAGDARPFFAAETYGMILYELGRADMNTCMVDWESIYTSDPAEKKFVEQAKAKQQAAMQGANSGSLADALNACARMLTPELQAQCIQLVQKK